MFFEKNHRCLRKKTVHIIDNNLIREKNAELEAERNSLVAALANVNQLSVLLPLCSNCKKVRDDSGYWQQVEQ
jgi:hypothetical protein